MILLEDLVRRTVISASSLMVNSTGLPMFMGPICHCRGCARESFIIGCKKRFGRVGWGR